MYTTFMDRRHDADSLVNIVLLNPLRSVFA